VKAQQRVDLTSDARQFEVDPGSWTGS
jgi:hypothetical protein